MTFKAYLDNIQAKTGKSPEDFFALANKKGLVKNGKIVAKYSELLAWLKSDIGLGHGMQMLRFCIYASVPMILS